MSEINVTVVIVTYNQEKWIAKTLDSILSQKTNYRYEVIIGEDNGTDNTRNICQEYADRYGNVTLLPQTTNLGVTANWIRCIKAGTGKYIMNCAGDDYWHNPNKIQMQVDFMESHPECVICHTDLDVLHNDTGLIEHNYSRLKNFPIPQGKIQREILRGKGYINAVTVCFRRDSFEKYVPCERFIELQFPREDWPTQLVLSAHGQVLYLEESTATYRVGQESITNTSDYDKIIQRVQKDRVMTEYLYTMFPEWGEFKDGPYFDHIGYHNALLAAYRNKDYSSAKEFAKKDTYPSWATRMAHTKLTFLLFRWIIFKHKN